VIKKKCVLFSVIQQI